MSKMMHPQTARFVAAIAQNLPAISGEQMQYWIEHPIELRRSLTDALRPPKPNLVLDCSKQLDVKKCLGNGWEVDEEDQRSAEMTKVDFANIFLKIRIRSGEHQIEGEEKLVRLKLIEDKVRMGGNVFLALWQNYLAYKEKSVLEFLHKKHSIEYLDFMGLIVRDVNEKRYTLFLSRSPALGWSWEARSLEAPWGLHDFSGLI